MKSLQRHLLSFFTLVLALISSNTLVNAQDQEFGFMIGGSNYHGDLAYNPVLGETHLAGGLHYRYNFNSHWSWRPSVMYGEISGSDVNFEENKYRNLSFRSNIWEVSSIFEYNFVPFGARILSEDFASYVMIGIAGFRFNPTTDFRGNNVELRKMRTEGQSDKEMYKIIQLAVPFGGGVKYNLSKNWVLGLEVGWRFLFTDYLDDVSTEYPDLKIQRETYGDLSADLSDRSWEVDGVGEPLSLAGDMRGDPALRDWYFFTTFNLSYRLTPITCWPRYKKPYLFN